MRSSSGLRGVIYNLQRTENDLDDAGLCSASLYFCCSGTALDLAAAAAAVIEI